MRPTKWCIGKEHAVDCSVGSICNKNVDGHLKKPTEDPGMCVTTNFRMMDGQEFIEEEPSESVCFGKNSLRKPNLKEFCSGNTEEGERICPTFDQVLSDREKATKQRKYCFLDNNGSRVTKKGANYSRVKAQQRCPVGSFSQ